MKHSGHALLVGAGGQAGGREQDSGKHGDAGQAAAAVDHRRGWLCVHGGLVLSWLVLRQDERGSQTKIAEKAIAQATAVREARERTFLCGFRVRIHFNFMSDTRWKPVSTGMRAADGTAAVRPSTGSG